MSRAYINLAREPYVNSRPVVRVSVLLWIVGAAFLAGNVWLYWDFLAGRGDTHARLDEVNREIAATEGRITELETSLAGFELEAQNERVEYLNARIERRHFSWSVLFDTFATLLPDDVRLSRLSPSTPDERRSGRSNENDGDGERVLLRIDAMARDDESILAMVDALFEAPAFEEPTLIQQTRDERGLIRFNLETVYDPEPDPPEVAETAGTGVGGRRRNIRPLAVGAAASAPPGVAP